MSTFLAKSYALTMFQKTFGRFESFFHTVPGSIKNSCRVGSGSPHLLVTGIIHGNEVGPLPGILRVLEELQSGGLSFSGSITVALGNIPAALQNKRFVDVDMNRVFGVSSPEYEEERRALEIAQLISTADLYLDFHQTIEASLRPFYVMASHPESVLWAKALQGITDFVFQSPDEDFVPGALCSDEYAQRLGIPALSIECWQKGFRKDAEDLTYSLICQAIQFLMRLEEDSAFLSSIAQQSLLQSWKIKYRHRNWQEGDFLHEGLVNLQEVTENQILGTKSNGQPLLCPEDGILLFPKYFKNQPRGGTIKDSLFVLAASEPA